MHRNASITKLTISDIINHHHGKQPTSVSVILVKRIIVHNTQMVINNTNSAHHTANASGIVHCIAIVNAFQWPSSSSPSSQVINFINFVYNELWLKLQKQNVEQATRQTNKHAVHERERKREKMGENSGKQQNTTNCNAYTRTDTRIVEL